MFRSKILQRMRHGVHGVPPRPVAEACASPAPAAIDAHAHPLAPLPLPEVLEDNSDAAWLAWLAANGAPETAETTPMELRPED